MEILCTVSSRVNLLPLLSVHHAETLGSRV